MAIDISYICMLWSAVIDALTSVRRARNGGYTETDLYICIKADQKVYRHDKIYLQCYGPGATILTPCWKTRCMFNDENSVTKY